MQLKARLAPTALILTCLLAVAWPAAGPVPGAAAARYTVAQCGWKVGNDGDWLETAVGRFSRSSWCGVPAGSDAWDGVHVTSGIRGSTAAVGGTKFARWRWTPPPGTGIVTVSGTRWNVLKDNFQHRLGSVPAGGSFTPFAEFSATDTARAFSRSFSPPAAGFESRLLCARPADRFCSVTGTSVAGIRGLTMTVNDPVLPSSTINGEFLSERWLRGTQTVEYSSSDSGSGVRSSQTWIDGAVRAETEHPCGKARIAGQWQATRMQPCRTGADGRHAIDTAKLSDGPHQITGCAIDFALNRGCAPNAVLRSDNTAPSAPRALAVSGGDGWHRSGEFAVSWVEPAQGVAAPIAGSRHRITGPGGFDTGVVAATSPGGLSGLEVRTPGEYRLAVWLVDAAGNDNPATGSEVTLRFDDISPTAFLVPPTRGLPERLRVTVHDAHSGPAGGIVEYRREGGDQWRPLSTRIDRTGDRAELTARFPSGDLPPGIYAIRATVRDGAGNETVSYVRASGARLTLRAPLKRATRLEAGLSGGGRSGRSITVPFGRPATVSGRLRVDGGGGVAAEQVAVSQLFAAGSRAARSVRMVRTGPGGRFSMRLAPGPSRRVTVSFAGDRRLSGSSTSLRLGVLGSLSFSLAPTRLQTGERVRFRGRVRSGAARRPSRGNLIAIRFFEQSSGAWRPMLVTRTDAWGRYRAAYRFRYVTGVARIRMRATLLPSQAFPYLPANSPVAGLRVHG